MQTSEKFTNKVTEYEKFRPQYPRVFFDILKNNLKSQSRVADIGAGTGYVSIPLAKDGYTVVAIEPNDGMRQILAAKTDCLDIDVKDSKAQDTGIDTNSIDLITLGNVAHWLDQNSEKHQRCLTEFSRILKPSGKVSVLSLSPSMHNGWITDIFNMVKGHDPDFDIDKISNSFENHQFHADNFINQTTDCVIETFSELMKKCEFIEFILSHSFATPAMVDEIAAIYQRHKNGDHINLAFKSSVYIGTPKLTV
jgi:ubiquinone/menaquinone biosynthesis C-methylase UbiE